jgi:flagellar biosynthesis/type III secretory pathway protein FliH
MTTNNKSKKSRNEQDTAWKEILEVYFKDFVSFCLPELYELIDWEKQPVSLDKELQAITKGTEMGKRFLDKLFKVFLKDGSDQRLLIHMELQGRFEDVFPKRMFTYGYRIWDRYQQPLVSCAILTDNNQDWRPNFYEVKFGGTCLRAEFLLIKLIDYRERQKELEESTNPFASVILAQLAALDSRTKSSKQRRNVKFMLTKRLYEKGFSKKEISNLYKFIDWLIGLPEELEIDYLQNVYELEEALKMPYITSAEKYGFEIGHKKGHEKGHEKGHKEGHEKGHKEGHEKGHKEGHKEGRLETARRLLAEGVDPAFVAKVTALSSIKELLELT